MHGKSSNMLLERQCPTVALSHSARSSNSWAQTPRRRKPLQAPSCASCMRYAPIELSGPVHVKISQLSLLVQQAAPVGGGHYRSLRCFITRSHAAVSTDSLIPTETEPQARLLVVDTQISAPFMRAKVSLGPPRHAAQLGDAGGTQPAALNTSAAVFPSHPGTGCPYTSAQTCSRFGRWGLRAWTPDAKAEALGLQCRHLVCLAYRRK